MLGAVVKQTGIESDKKKESKTVSQRMAGNKV